MARGKLENTQATKNNMTMIRPKGKALKIAESVMKKKAVKIPTKTKPKKLLDLGPYLQH